MLSSTSPSKGVWSRSHVELESSRRAMTAEVPGGSFKHWCHRELSRILGYNVDDSLLDYLLSIEGERDMKEYLQDILGEDTKRAEVFMHEFFRHWQPPSQALPISIDQLDVVDENTTVLGPDRDCVILFAKNEDTSKVWECWQRDSNV